MVTVIDNSAEISEEQADQGVNSNNSYEELKQQVNKLKEEYNNNEDFKKPFDYFLWIDNSNHNLVKEHGEIMRLIKSHAQLDREEMLLSIKGVDSRVSNTISDTKGSSLNIIETKKVA